MIEFGPGTMYFLPVDTEEQHDLDDTHVAAITRDGDISVVDGIPIKGSRVQLDLPEDDRAAFNRSMTVIPEALRPSTASGTAGEEDGDDRR